MKNIRTSYKQYKKDCQNTVDIKTYIDISTRYIKFLMDKVVDGYEVTLPNRLGTLRVYGIKQEVKFVDGKIKGLSPNWQKTLELWRTNPEAKEKKQMVYNTNEHSGGMRYKFIWSKTRILVLNKSLYSLRMTRENKRKIYKAVMAGKEYV